MTPTIHEAAVALIGVTVACILAIPVSIHDAHGAAALHRKCHVAGDSIALGVGAYLRQCSLDATKSVPSAEVIRKAIEADTCIISAGSNDADNPSLSANLIAIRMRCKHRVIWIEPIAPRPNHVVREIAKEFGDITIPFTPGRDNIHPRSYEDLAKSVGVFL